MAHAAGPPIGETPINLRAHEIRCGNIEGAREDFEAMLAELVQVSHPDAIRIQARRGDGGIDVMTGDLRGGSIAIWQAKYFIGIGRHQQDQIRKSFHSAVNEAARQGYKITEWVLCVPADLTRENHRWWGGWRDDAEAATGVRIGLWGATELRGLLIRPDAQAIRAHYYGSAQPMHIESYPTIFVSGTSPTGSWKPGGELSLGGHAYFLADDATEIVGEGRSWLWQEGSAGRLDTGHERVCVVRVRALRPASPAEALRTGLQEQARLLRALAGKRGLPRVVHSDDDTLVTAHPGGSTWREAFGPRPGRTPDRVTAALMCASAIPLAEALEELHRHGHTHRAVGPETVVVLMGSSPRAMLRDGGRVALPAIVDEGPPEYRAPEQTYIALAPGEPSPATDVYRYAALLYATLTGHPPTAMPVPLRAALPDIPATLDDLVLRCLREHPGQRPDRTDVFVGALTETRHALAFGGHL